MTMARIDDVLSDLAAESLQVDHWVGGLTADDWATVFP